MVKLIDRLERKYNVSDSAIRVLRLENSYQLSTREEYAPYIKRAMENKRQARLSPAALEVLAVVAYNQPVTKAFVEQVRGTDSSGVINTLVERELLYEAGRLELPGRPITYKTTDNFLRCFKLESLAQLPSLPDEDGQLNLNEIGTLQQDGDFIRMTALRNNPITPADTLIGVPSAHQTETEGLWAGLFS